MGITFGLLEIVLDLVLGITFGLLEIVLDLTFGLQEIILDLILGVTFNPPTGVKIAGVNFLTLIDAQGPHRLGRRAYALPHLPPLPIYILSFHWLPCLPCVLWPTCPPRAWPLPPLLPRDILNVSTITTSGCVKFSWLASICRSKRLCRFVVYSDFGRIFMLFLCKS